MSSGDELFYFWLVWEAMYFCFSSEWHFYQVEYSWLGSFFLSILTIPCSFLLTCKISAEKSVNSVMRVSLHITSYFFLAIFKSLFLALTFDNLVIMFLRVGLFVFLLFGIFNGTPLQYSCLENPMDRGAWKAAVHGVAKRQTRLSDFTFTFMHWRREWQPTPVFLPGESQGRGSLVGCCLWGYTESDTTEAT